MPGKLIDEPELIMAIRTVAATEPDRIYRSGHPTPAGDMLLTCTYLPNIGNDCGCLVGEGMLMLGVPRQVLAGIDDAAERRPTGWGMPEVKSRLAGWLTERALASPWVFACQMAQDQGQSWPDAVAQADTFADTCGWAR